MGSLKVALVHDYLNQLGGAERVLEILYEMFPDAPIYTLLVEHDKLWPSLKQADIKSSVLQRFSFVRRHFKLFFWLYPFIIRRFKLNDYDLIISSSSAYAKGIRLPSSGRRPVHICYCYTPMRFAWDFDEYIRNEKGNGVLKFFAKLFVAPLKNWDVSSSYGVDHFIAISTVVNERIKKYYDRESKIIHPPVVLNGHLSGETDKSLQKSGGYLLVVSRLISYKRIDLAVKICSEQGYKLIVIGTGPDRDRLESMANDNVEFLGWQSDSAVDQYMRNCSALIFPGIEDFGITPLEVNLRGKPVVAFKGGGALDTITNGVNGVFFEKHTQESLLEALLQIEIIDWDHNRIVECAMRFDKMRFMSEVRKFVGTKLELVYSDPLI